MIIEVKNGCFGYSGKDMILSNINFNLKDGEIVSVLGQNGVGKTTMLKCLTGILKWKKGGTYINSKRVELVSRMNEISYVPQAHSLSFPYTVQEMISMGRARYVSLFSVPSKDDKIRVNEIIKEIGIEHIIDFPCTELSGGQLQLVYIARALVSDPKVLILDEPESHLDYKNQLMILNMLKSLVENKKISCIINTHYPEHALKISDKTIFMGRDDYIFGNTLDIITEENLKKYFDVNVKIVSIPFKDGYLKSVIAL